MVFICSSLCNEHDLCGINDLFPVPEASNDPPFQTNSPRSTIQFHSAEELPSITSLLLVNGWSRWRVRCLAEAPLSATFQKEKQKYFFFRAWFSTIGAELELIAANFYHSDRSCSLFWWGFVCLSGGSLSFLDNGNHTSSLWSSGR